MFLQYLKQLYKNTNVFLHIGINVSFSALAQGKIKGYKRNINEKVMQNNHLLCFLTLGVFDNVKQNI